MKNEVLMNHDPSNLKWVAHRAKNGCFTEARSWYWPKLRYSFLQPGFWGRQQTLVGRPGDWCPACPVCSVLTQRNFNNRLFSLNYLLLRMAVVRGTGSALDKPPTFFVLPWHYRWSAFCEKQRNRNYRLMNYLTYVITWYTCFCVYRWSLLYLRSLPWECTEAWCQRFYPRQN